MQLFIKTLQMLLVARWRGSERLIYCLIAPPQAGEEEQHLPPSCIFNGAGSDLPARPAPPALSVSMAGSVLSNGRLHQGVVLLIKVPCVC